MAELNVDTLGQQGLLLFECVSGSKAYGLDTPESDTDIRGIFVMPEDMFYSLNRPAQVADTKNDRVYYELDRAAELLLKNNPTLLELLYTDPQDVLFRHPLLDLLPPQMFLSKLCFESFAGYARSQIRKARGLNKKIVNPMSQKRKGILEFCHVPYHQGSIPVEEWLGMRGLKQEQCGLASIPHMPQLYGLYVAEKPGAYFGIARKEYSNDVTLSSIPKGEEPLTVMSFNKDGYIKYCRDYKEYWDWVENRNEARYTGNITHGRNYDSKNMMHTFRLLSMAEEIATDRIIRVRRPDREELFRIRHGEYEYEELLERAEEKVKHLERLFENSALPDKPDEDRISEAVYRIRKGFYS